MEKEQLILICKALSNEGRLNILKKLKKPEENFPAQMHLQQGDDFYGGICVGDIQAETGLVQSTTSQYLAILEESGLLEKQRVGQWTYYRRDEGTIKELQTFIGRIL